jgi:hypothetical protein
VQTSVATYNARRNPLTVAAYARADGQFSAAGTGRGKDLFVRRGQVHATGYPLYWRPEDDHFLSPMEIETPNGPLAVTTDSVSLLQSTASAEDKLAAAWAIKPYDEIAAVAVTNNALLVTGLDRDPLNWQRTSSGLTALSLSNGSPLWKQSLPAAPVAWGLAVDRAGQMIVTLIDGRVVCLAGE